MRYGFRLGGRGVGRPDDAYDQLHDFIKDNREFAAAVAKFVPWVKGPDDVIMLLDIYIIEAGASDYYNQVVDLLL
jgi:hypothetical protein